ncbi:MAG: class D beta-lactamase [Bacteroidetes bacterium]|nr:class D beta-lactamase [Bacteroidota bacterium]
MKKLLTYTILIMLAIISCRHEPSTAIRTDFKKFYDRYRVEGSFSLYDPGNDRYILYNPTQFKQGFIPASTFKIVNSLIGLETGVIRDGDFVIQWDSVIRPNPKWNVDQDLKTAFKNSTVWYYQELARRVGGKQMKRWLDEARYGNADTSGGIDRFWLNGGIRISPEQQIGFLQRLHDSKLPFSQRAMDIVKQIMIAKDTLGYIIRAKTGRSSQDGKEIGWYVGYLENNNHLYYFANCIQTNDPDNQEFAAARINIVYQILDELVFSKQ